MCLDKTSHIIPKNVVVATVAMVTGHDIDFKRTICAQLFPLTVRPITFKLSKIITDIYILNFTERNFDQSLVTLKIGH